MSKIFVNYPKCSTCKRAEKFLKENNVEFVNRNIVEENPTAEELSLWMDKSGLEPRKFFNTSGVLYREMNLKDKIKTMSKEEMIEILSTNGMLVKRPLLVTEDIVLVGFKEENYKEVIPAPLLSRFTMKALFEPVGFEIKNKYIVEKAKALVEKYNDKYGKTIDYADVIKKIDKNVINSTKNFRYLNRLVQKALISTIENNE